MTDTGTDEPATSDGSATASENDNATGGTTNDLDTPLAARRVAPPHGAMTAAREVNWDKLSAASRLAEKVAKAGVLSQVPAIAAVSTNVMSTVDVTPKFDFGVDWAKLTVANHFADVAAKAGVFAQLPSATRYANFVPTTDWGRFAGASAMAEMVASSGSFARLPGIAALSTSILPKFDFDPTGHFGSLLRQISALDLEQLHERFRPRNLRELDLDSAVIAALMEDEGLPFCLVPDAETAQMLLEADDRAARRRVLISRAGAIFDACDDVVALCVDRGLPEQGSLIRKAIRAYGDGHPEAAQALATVVMDRLVGQYKHQGQIKNAVDGVAFIRKLPWREWFFLLPIPVVHDKTWRIVDPALFNRNTTVHQVELTQLTASNAIQAIMLATSLLGFHQDLW